MEIPAVEFINPMVVDGKPDSAEQCESHDDLLDDYEERFIATKCSRSKHLRHQVLVIVIFILLIVNGILVISLVKVKRVSIAETELCVSVGCVKAASSLLSSMDMNVRPCYDFYRYACGGWEKASPFPKNKIIWDRYQELSDHTYYKLEHLLVKDSQNKFSRSVTIARKFYKLCLNIEHISDNEYLQMFHKMLEASGGWTFGTAVNMSRTSVTIRNMLRIFGTPRNMSSTFSTARNMSSFDVSSTLIYLHDLGVYSLFKLDDDVDIHDPLQYILKIKLPDISPSFAETGFKLPMNSWNETMMSDYHDMMIRTITLLSGQSLSQRQLHRDADDVLQFMLMMSKLTSSEAMRHKDHNFVRYNISEMVTKFSCCGKYFQRLLNKFNEYDNPLNSVANPEILVNRNVESILNVVSNYSQVEHGLRTVQNYLVWTMITTMQQFFGRDLLNSKCKELSDNWKRCIFYTNRAFSLVTGALYINSTYDRSYIDEVSLLTKYIKSAFKDYLLQKFWMDERTKQLASLKIDAIIDRISYSQFPINVAFLDDYYSQFNIINGDWISTIISWQQFDLSKTFIKLKGNSNQSRWLHPPIDFHTYYAPQRNDLFFPAAILQPPFFNPEWPQAINFGALGSIIGHEITHAFDVLGRQYDKDGHLRNWWGNITDDGYKRAVPCMLSQYSSYHLHGYTVCGQRTITENVADNGGLRAALLGYRLWKMEKKIERSLPGLNLTNDELFFISFAQTHCAKYKDRGALDVTTSDHHSPHPIRVLGTIMNSEDFSHIFRCGRHDPMNSPVKCIIW